LIRLVQDDPQRLRFGLLRQAMAAHRPTFFAAAPALGKYVARIGWNDLRG
jgi:hypothetical protein